ncbi:MAG: PfkB family carbohydrate kinase [Chloroflexota bacterium]
MSLSFGEDRSFVSYSDPGGPLLVDSVRRLRPRVVMWQGLERYDAVEQIVDVAREVGAVLFVDPQSSTHSLASPRIRELLGRIDVFAPNEREAILLTGDDDIDRAEGSLVQSTRLVVLKPGSCGAVAADLDGRLAVPAIPVQAIETTGAGDCFNAGFVMAWVESEDIVGCLQAGNAAGGLSTLAPSSEGIPVRSAVDLARAAFG